MLDDIIAESIVIFVARQFGRFGRLKTHVIPAEILKTVANLAEALRAHGRAGSALAREKSGREGCERLGFAVGHRRAPYWPTTRRPKPPTGRGLA